jgi:hypothetical protein
MTIYDYIENPGHYDKDSSWAYLEWLAMEARLLRLELEPKLDPDLEFSPVNTFSHNFHFPDCGWQSAPKPSTRALQVMRAAGVTILGDERPNALMPLMGRPGAFLHEVADDTMEPTYRRRFSAVICVPVKRYMGEGVYLVEGRLFRAQKGGKYIVLSRDNKLYPDQEVHMDSFAASAPAMVVADVTVRNTTLLRRAA